MGLNPNSCIGHQTAMKVKAGLVLSNLFQGSVNASSINILDSVSEMISVSGLSLHVSHKAGPQGCGI